LQIYYSPSDFINGHLSQLRQSQGENAQTHVLFSTYNNVSGVSEGPFETHCDDLTITVDEGNMPLNFGILMADMLPTEIRQQAQKEARQVSIDFASNFLEGQPVHANEAVSSSDQHVTVIYLGLNGLKAGIEFLKKLKQNDPNHVVIGVSCSCNNERQFRQWADLIDTLIITGQCGGWVTMKTILDGFLTTWEPQ